LFTDNSGAIIVSDIEAQDIDELPDWQLAEYKYQILKQSSFANQPTK
jgi:N-acylneuraminate cytidylyltransferase